MIARLPGWLEHQHQQQQHMLRLPTAANLSFFLVARFEISLALRPTWP
jgi:hypothetical protein